MTATAGGVRLRAVEDSDLEVFYQHQVDPEATRIAVFPPRGREAFLAHWARIRADDALVARTIVAGGEVAGNIGSWAADGRQLIGYWIGRSYWGRGIATAALTQFLDTVATRPLYAHVAVTNLGSIRVLEKCGFEPATPAETPAPDPDDVEEVLLVRRY